MKVLQLPSRSKIALIFVCPRTNAPLLTSIHIVLPASPGSRPTLTFRPNTAFPAASKCCHNEPFKYKIQQNSKPSLNARILFLYSIIKQSISHHPAFFTSQHFTLPENTFKRRTSGHSLATLVAVYSVAPRPPAQCFSLQPPACFLSFSVLKRIIEALFSGFSTLGSSTTFQ